MTEISITPLIPQVIEKLYLSGLRRIVVCPGGRNTWLVKCLLKDNRFTLYWGFEERSSAFYALGLGLTDREPIGVLTTSGTAVLECLPAFAEAHFQNQSLVLIAADRPLEMRHTGAPQTLDQVSSFKPFVSNVMDLVDSDHVESFLKRSMSLSESTLINICLEEPSRFSNRSEIGKESINIIKKEGVRKKTSENENKELNHQETQNFLDFKSKVNDVTQYLGQNSILYFSSLHGDEARYIQNILRDYEGYVYLEALSNLTSEDFPQSKVIKTEKTLDQFLKYKNKDGESLVLLKLGRTPLLKFWRDLDLYACQFYSVSPSKYTGHLCAVDFRLLDVKEKRKAQNLKFDSEDLEYTNQDTLQINSVESSQSEKLINTKKNKIENEEFSYVKEVLSFSKEGSTIFAGNSLSVRWVQKIFLQFESKKLKYHGLRGLNGIDGLVSAAIGLASRQREDVYLVVGDLSFMYDLQAFWFQKNLKSNLHVFVLNNGGGQIFTHMGLEQEFTHPHDYQFKGISDFWSLKYMKCDSAADFSSKTKNLSLEKTKKVYLWDLNCCV